MKLVATAQTFSHQNRWTEYEIYRHGQRYRIQEEDCGLGWGLLCDDEEPSRRWGSAREIRWILSMDYRDAGTVDIIDESEYDKIFKED